MSDPERLVLSAKWWTVLNLIALCKSFGPSHLYRRKRSGPRTDPCGTSYFISLNSESYPLTEVNWVLPDR